MDFEPEIVYELINIASDSSDSNDLEPGAFEVMAQEGEQVIIK